MKRKILIWLLERLQRMTYEELVLDKVNKKLIRPVPGLIIDGVQYYEFVNLADMPRMRMVHYSYMREEMVMGLDRPFLLEMIGKIQQANNRQDTNTIAGVTIMLKDILCNITTTESLYNMASVMYFDMKEDIGSWDFDYNADKIRRFKSFRDKSFFFSYLLQHSLKTTSDRLPDDIQQFLNENAQRLSVWKSILSEPIGSES